MTDLIYLDNAATSFPKPDVVHDEIREFYSRYGVNPGRSGCDLGLAAEEMIHRTRGAAREDQGDDRNQSDGRARDAGQDQTPDRSRGTVRGRGAAPSK